MSFHLRGSVFTEPKRRSGLHNLVVPLLPACIAGCIPVRHLTTLWPSTLQYYSDFYCDSESPGGRDVQAGLTDRMVYQRHMRGLFVFYVGGIWFN
jgi:hypothetical protein